ncbi:MAG: flagellar biosynthesis protein FlhA [Nitrospirae bacterium]|nr:flagellar biosynthesis protein FlhA [Nitrospirota bacterium]MBI3594029.1 flagellar biosynthesis protein FlhA [Nitrospirota bacterium]
MQSKSDGLAIKGGGIALSVGVVGVLLLMIIPLHPVILDLFLVFNLGLALVIIFVSMYTLRPMEFSVFPSILLVVTLFRLSLNVAATRLILLHGGEGAGAAGQVIKAIGDFVVGGSYTVGIIVFIILIVINFVVITKGAGRIAEVAARFILDAMPGKQMSIDADLNAGLIDEKEARKRRSAISSEADFYGAMDGASKFVRGDAIAAILIIVVNIVGGLVIGIFQKGMTLADAAQNFTLLTVGEGLVAQFPGLIISTAAGIVMTRAASESNLGSEVSRQILLHPQALYAAAGIIFVLGMIPGFPHLAFLTLAGGMGGIGLIAERTKQAEKKASLLPEKTKIETVTNEKGEGYSPLDLMELNIGYSLISLVDETRGGELLKRIAALRKQLATELGFVVPPIHIRDNLQMKPNEYQILIKGIEVAGGELMAGHFLAMNPSGGERGIPGIPTKEPCFGLPAIWVTEQEKERAQIAGFTVVDPPSVIATHLTEIIRSHAHELLGRQEVQHLLDQYGKHSPKLVEELIPHLLTVGAVTRVLGNLLKERVPIRDLRTILETLADYAPGQKDADHLTEFVRQALSRTITHQYQSANRNLNVIGLDPRLDHKIASGIQQSNQGSFLTLDPVWVQQILGKIKQAADRMAIKNEQPVLLCSPVTRPHIKRLMERAMPAVPVLSTGEVSPQVRIVAMENIIEPQ